jgi:hypothetical protein
MKTVVRYLFVLVVLIIVAVPVYSAAPAQSKAPAQAAAPAQSAAPADSADPASSDTDDEVLQVFMCEMSEGTTEEQVDELAQVKFKAIRQMPGGEEAKLNILWPVVVSNTGAIDFWVVWTFPSFVDWGKFWDAYNDASPAARADDIMEGKVECPDSMMWEAHNIVMPK